MKSMIDQTEMKPIAKKLAAISALTSKYGHYSVGCGEWQEALEVFLLEASDKDIELPVDIITDVRAISDDLLPPKMLAAAVVSSGSFRKD